jgi:hypothetical protein
MNQNQKGKFETRAKAMLAGLRLTLKPGQGRKVDEKEGNYREVVDLLRELSIVHRAGRRRGVWACQT